MLGAALLGAKNVRRNVRHSLAVLGVAGTENCRLLGTKNDGHNSARRLR